MFSFEYVTLIKDLFICGAAITGAVVAVKGLNTWQRQLKGQSEYELSRRILVSLYKFRDAIDGVRYPAIWVHEQPQPTEKEAARMSDDEIHFYGISNAYKARFNKVNNVRVSLYADLLEAEALWGSELNKRFEVLFKLEHNLFIFVEMHLKLVNPRTEKDTKKETREIYKKERGDSILYEGFNNNGDEYKKDFMGGVERIEEYLKPRLTSLGDRKNSSPRSTWYKKRLSTIE